MTEAWMQILVILGTNTALFLWARSEARHDQQELREITRMIQSDSREFHARISVMETNKKK